MKKLLIVLAVVFLLPVAAFAIDWLEIAQSKTDDVLYLDKDSIINKGEISFCRYKIVIKNPNNELKQMNVSYVVYIKAFNCKNKTHSVLKAINYDENGQAVFETKSPLSDFEEIQSGSFAQSVYNYLCS